MPEPVFFDFAQLYDADEYLYFMASSLAEEDTPKQVDFLVERLGMAPPMRVVDLGCGHGRHALELSRRGFKVTGVDLVEGFLERARKEAEARGLDAVFVRGDIGAFQVERAFDRAICMFDAFGYFDDAHSIQTLACVHRALDEGGKLLLDLRTREWMTRIPPASVLDLGNGDLMIDRHHFDIETGRFVDRRSYLRDGRLREVMFSVRLYAFTEIRLILTSLGFEVEAAYGGFDGSPLSALKPRTLIVARKAAAPAEPGEAGA